MGTLGYTMIIYFFPPNSRMLWGLSPHSLRGAPGHCSTLPPRFAGSGNQGSENRFREPGFGARFREPRVPGTRVRGKVPGTQGSANQTFKQGSGNNGFWLPFGFRDVKVPGRFRAHLAFDKVPGTLPWFRAARAWIVPKFWNHRNTNFETSCKPRVWGTRILARFQQHWVPTRFREPPQMRTHSLDILPGLCHRFRTGTRSEFWQGSEVPETTQGSDIRRGLYQGSCYGQGPQKTNLQGNQGSRTKRARSTSNRWQGGGQRDNKSARLGSGNPGFQYTLWVAPRFRKRGFQEDKVPGTQGGFRKSPSQSWVLCGPSLNSEFMFVCSVGAQRRSTDLFWCCCKIFCLNCSDVASTKAHATSSN